jgi:carbon monoxide dehydrogenase subunit G
VIDLGLDRATLDGGPEALWGILEDADALARVLPGAESVTSSAPGRFEGLMATKIGFVTLRADVEATLQDPDPPRSVRLDLRGRLRGLAGSFALSIPFELEAVDGPRGPSSRTLIAYTVELRMTGRLATFGTPLIREAMRRQINELVANVDRELARRRSAEAE